MLAYWCMFYQKLFEVGNESIVRGNWVKPKSYIAELWIKSLFTKQKICNSSLGHMLRHHWLYMKCTVWQSWMMGTTITKHSKTFQTASQKFVIVQTKFSCHSVFSSSIRKIWIEFGKCAHRDNLQCFSIQEVSLARYTYGNVRL